MKWRSLEESSPETEIRPLREIFAERKELISKYVPPQTQAVHAATITALKQQHLAANIFLVGAKIPEFQLQDHDRHSNIGSSDLLAKARLVLCFIRGRWCPFCVAPNGSHEPYPAGDRQAGATLAAISPQTVQQSFFMRDQHKLRFPLLSDPGNKVAKQFGLTYRVPDEQKAIYQRAFVNLALRERRRQLAIANPRNLHHRPRRYCALRFSKRGLHRASRARRDRALLNQFIRRLR